MKTFGRRNFVAGGAILAASTPWWVTLRNCFGPSGTIHDQKVRVATDDDLDLEKVDWQRNILRPTRELQEELQADMNEWHKQKMLEREVFPSKTRSELLPNGGTFSNTMGPPITPQEAAVLAVNRVRGTNA